MQVVGNGCALPELGDRPGAESLLAVGGVTLPDRQRGPPVAIPRQRPVDVVLKPLAESALLDVLGMPADLLVGGQQLLADIGRADVPARLRVVEQRGVAAPAMRIGVQVGLGPKQPAALLQSGDDIGVGVLDESAREVGDPLVEAAARVDRVLERDPVLLAEPEVVLAEGDRGVDEPGSLVGGYEVPEQDGVAARAVVGDVVERGLVGRAGELGAGEAVENLGVLAQHLLDQAFGQHQDLALVAHPRVADLLAGGDRRV